MTPGPIMLEGDGAATVEDEETEDAVEVEL